VKDDPKPITDRSSPNPKLPLRCHRCARVLDTSNLNALIRHEEICSRAQPTPR